MSARLAVVVALISGRKEHLQRCLAAIHAQKTRLPIEIIVPYDEPCADVVDLRSEFPGVSFILAEGLDSRAARAGASREHHDRLRTIGLRAATADVVALTEDHAHMADDWCEEAVAAIERHPRAGAVGGAVECGSTRILNRAVWFCDFGRYQNPLPDAPAAFVSDSNVAYRRSALSLIDEAWRSDYHETAVHDAIARAGLELRTTPRMVVWQSRSNLRWAEALRERFVWGRSYAGTRARLVGTRRWIYAALTPILPALMTWRLLATAFQRGRHRWAFCVAAPAIVLLQCVWAAGEAVGYLTATPA